MNNSEIVFIYDGKKVNPNGDPLDDNRPRIDEETGKCIVTDVRLKRYIRDYLDFCGEKVFIQQHIDDKGIIASRDKLLEINNIKPTEIEEKIRDFIDIRLFGVVVASKKENFNLTGPVQFRFGESMHNVNPIKMDGTTVIASGDGKKNGTFWSHWYIPYCAIKFYGMISSENAKHTNLTDDDIKKLDDAIWNGVQNTISRSKIGQTSRFYLRVEYNNPHFFIGDLERYVSVKYKKDDLELRDWDDVELDVSRLVKVLGIYKDKIKNVYVKCDDENIKQQIVF